MWAHVQSEHYVPEPQNFSFFTFPSMLQFPTRVSVNTTWDMSCYEKGTVVPGEFHD